MWNPGQSGNPKGRSKKCDSAARAIGKRVTASEWGRMADRLKKMVLIGDDDNAAVRAYASLADRAFGKPVQKNENEDVTPDKGKVFRFHIVQSQEVKK